MSEDYPIDPNQFANAARQRSLEDPAVAAEEVAYRRRLAQGGLSRKELALAALLLGFVLFVAGSAVWSLIS